MSIAINEAGTIVELTNVGDRVSEVNLFDSTGCFNDRQKQIAIDQANSITVVCDGGFY